MKSSQMRKLQPGDMIRNTNTGSTYVVVCNHGTRITARRTVEITDTSEWEMRFSRRDDDIGNNTVKNSAVVAYRNKAA